MRWFVLAVVVLAAGGCKPAQPTQAGGKPVSYWVEALKGPDARLRKKAVGMLGNVGSADAAALPAVIGALKDADPAVRREAVFALVKFGPAAREAVPALTELCDRDEDPEVRSRAGKALEKIRGEGEKGP
jgi:HEAT repeat protein